MRRGHSAASMKNDSDGLRLLAVRLRRTLDVILPSCEDCKRDHACQANAYHCDAERRSYLEAQKIPVAKRHKLLPEAASGGPRRDAVPVGFGRTQISRFFCGY